MAFYRLNVLNECDQQQQQSDTGQVERTVKNDNVDQRITQDVDKMANSLSAIIPEIIISPFIIGNLA